jgi:outer membrane protein assembly factor BamB
VFGLTADGLVRALNPHTGEMAAPPAKFLTPNATASGLILADGVLYAATTNNCGGAPEAVWAMEYAADAPTAADGGARNDPNAAPALGPVAPWPGPVTTWKSEGAPIIGFALGTDGTVYASTGSGASRYANSIVALEGRTLKLKDWITHEAGFVSSPVVFNEGNRTYVTATGSGGQLYLLDAAALGGADHKTPVLATPAVANRPASSGRFTTESVATWRDAGRDAAGRRWILAPTIDGLVSFRLIETSGVPALEQAWRSRDFAEPRTPIVVNGVVFALAGGRNDGTNAVLYALDPASGKEIWSSGSTITSFASAGLSAGTGQVYVVTYDNTVWAFGIPLAIF